MAGAQFKTNIEAPRQTPSPSFSDRAPFSLGVPNKSVSQNHQPIAESFTSQPVNQSPESDRSSAFTSQPVNQSPESDRSSAFTNEPTSQLAAAGENEFYIPADQPPAAVPPAATALSETVKRGEYHPGYVQQMLDYFDRPKMKEVRDTYTWKTGAVSEKLRYIPNTPPHFTEFARSIGVSAATLKRWAAAHPEFGEAYQICQEIFEEFLIDNGLTGSYGAIAMKFVAVNRSKMKDKQTNENVNLDINDVLDQIAAGKLKPGGLLPGQEAN